jgi:Xaa-Pro aminopeptidase
LYLETEGRSRLIAPAEKGDGLADEQVTYEWHLFGTMNPDRLSDVITLARQQLAPAARPRRLGWQVQSLPRSLGDALDETLRPDAWVPIDEELAALEKRKDPDEVACIREAVACNLAAYDAVSRAIAPGVNELTVLEAGHTTATLRAGEPIYHGGDYRSGAMGGPARDRAVPAGELYIVDAQTRHGGYWSDLSRTYPVGEPTSLQREVYAHVAKILAGVPEIIEPGMDGAELWRRIDARLREHPHLREIGLLHHAGHGVGLRPHEAPDFNRDRGGVLEIGDVISCEPGAYSPELNAGIRLETMYLLTEDGVEVLSGTLPSEL